MTTNIATAIDQLGALKAQIAELERRENELKAILIEMGDGAYEGDVFRVTVSTADREYLDQKAVREKLSPQFIRAHTTVKSVTTVKVTTRNNVNLKVAA
jgi:hypothetical protein